MDVLTLDERAFVGSWVQSGELLRQALWGQETKGATANLGFKGGSAETLSVAVTDCLSKGLFKEGLKILY